MVVSGVVKGGVGIGACPPPRRPGHWPSIAVYKRTHMYSNVHQEDTVGAQ